MRLKRLLLILCSAICMISASGCDLLDEFVEAEYSENESSVSSSDSSDASSDISIYETESESEIAEESSFTESQNYTEYHFRYQDRLDGHYEKHGIEMGFESAEEYEAAANRVINSPDALHKLEKEDGDHVYFLEDTGEFVVLSTDGYIRTYYIATKKYFDRQ